MTQDISSLLDLVQKKDYAATNVAASLGAAAVPGLSGLVRDPDEEIRHLAVYCLIETADPQAAAPLGWALFDADPQVAMTAAKGFSKVATPAHTPLLLQALDRSTEPLVKREIALVLGGVAAPADIPEIKKRWEKEADPDARQGLTAALAKLGDDDARTTFDKALRGTTGPARLRYMELAEWIHEPWLLPALTEILNDPTDILRVAVDARPDLIQALRACDLAVVLIADLTAATFTFPVTRAHNYTSSELDEVRASLSAGAPPKAGIVSS